MIRKNPKSMILNKRRVGAGFILAPRYSNIGGEFNYAKNIDAQERQSSFF